MTPNRISNPKPSRARRFLPAVAALVAILGLSGCYYPYGPGPYGYGGGYGGGYYGGYAAAPVVVEGGYYGPRYRGWR